MRGMLDESINCVSWSRGNFCVGMSASAGAKPGFNIILPLSCVFMENKGVFGITREKFLKANVMVLDLYAYGR